MVIIQGIKSAESPGNTGGWWKFIIENEREKCLQVANEFLLSQPMNRAQVWESYKGLCQLEGIDESFLFRLCDEKDWLYWKMLYWMKQTAEELARESSSDQEVVETITRKVHQRIVPQEAPLQNDWPWNIWIRQYGLCDRQSWVLCEFLYQLGYEVSIVYLRDPQTRVSCHTIVEVRKEKDVWTVDPWSGWVLASYSIEQFADDLELVKKVWPQQVAWQIAIRNSTLYIPACPWDYALRTQLLARRYPSFKNSPWPRWGEDPRERQCYYDRLRIAQLGEKKAKDRYPLGLWNYPFRLLKEMESFNLPLEK